MIISLYKAYEKKVLTTVKIRKLIRGIDVPELLPRPRISVTELIGSLDTHPTLEASSDSFHFGTQRKTPFETPSTGSIRR